MPARDTDLTWIDLTDFSPGIQSGWHTMGGDEGGKDGTAQINGTWGCVASPNGGLEPAPALVHQIISSATSLMGSDTLDASWYDTAGIPGTVRIHDFKIQPMWHGDLSSGEYVDGDAAHQALEPDAIMFVTEHFASPSGVLGRRYRWRYISRMEGDGIFGLGDSNLFTGGGPAQTDQHSTQFGWAHCALIYSSWGVTPNPLLPGAPFGAFLFAIQSGSSTPPYVPKADWVPFVMYFPDPTNATQPNMVAHIEMAFTSNWSATWYKMISHNDRLVFTAAIFPTGWNGRSQAYGNGETKSDDTLFFHGINNVQDTTDTNIVQLTSDHIDSVGALISGAANQLFVIRNTDGGLIVSGSMENPQIDRYPGVEPVGGYCHTPVVTPMGVVYGTASGVFAWPGGDHATELSKGLDGDFWLTKMQWRHQDDEMTLNGRARRQPHTPTGTFAYRAPFVYCPNNYIFDTRTGGWFRLCEPEPTTTSNTEDRTSGVTLGHFGIGYAGKVYGAPTEIRVGRGADDTFNLGLVAVVFDPTVAADEWWWTSQPLVRGRNRILKAREFDMVASGVGTITTTISGLNGESMDRVFTFDGATQMRRQIFNVDCYDAVITFHAEGTNMRLHRASLGFHESTSTNRT